MIIFYFFYLSERFVVEWNGKSECKYSKKKCVKRSLKIDKTKSLMTNGSLLKVESIAEFFGAFCNTFDLH